MGLLTLIPLRVWLSLGAVVAILASLWGYGRHQYNEGATDVRQAYEKAAVEQREINAKASFRAIENTAVAVTHFVETETVIETRYVKDQTALADVWRYADRLRDELARRSAAPVEAASACAAQDRRLRSAEGIVGEYVEALATCTGVAVEGRHLAEELNNRVQLWQDYTKALP